MAYRNYVPGDKSIFNSPQKGGKQGSKFALLNNSLVQYSNASLGYDASRNKVGNKRSNSGFGKSRNPSRLSNNTQGGRGTSATRAK
mmetsp:Transcript_4049/g.3443  ORF Transcript_4049/g.3443 Transcript_4049/m.3443 type:complete len:86 (+) Transcript_4049:751-1008(+)